MARVAKAAEQLLRQVGGTVVGDPDGFGVRRSVRLDTHPNVSPLVTQKWLELDRRVRGVVLVDGSLLVTLVAGTAADDVTPFDI